MNQVRRSQGRRGARRVSPPLYKLLLTTHITVSVGWLGIVAAKLLLGVAAVTSDAAASMALYLSMGVLDVAFPPVAIGTLVTGVALSLGTKWGLLEHYWVATKLVLAVGVIVSAVGLGDRVVRQATSALPDGAMADATILGTVSAPATLLLSLSVAHVLMLGVATVLSVYKPWGKTWFSRRGKARGPARTSGPDRSAAAPILAPSLPR